MKCVLMATFQPPPGVLTHQLIGANCPPELLIGRRFIGGEKCRIDNRAKQLHTYGKDPLALRGNDRAILWVLPDMTKATYIAPTHRETANENETQCFYQ